ncbi:MAG: nickel pincer cofactor biosynthesis protein LarC [Proteobacteria bacterium]|nr:nickel pincer cofactor biosynthesis protein LarC [Pseudomonadota bacterium]
MGISGDMFLGAMIDLGVKETEIIREIRKLPIDPKEIDVKVARASRHSISAVTFKVRIQESTHHRTFKDIKKMITGSKLGKEVKATSIAIFKAIAVGEGKVHNISPEKVHFHEVGAIDSIIDIVGAAVAFHIIAPRRVVSTPVPLGTGWSNTMHGRLPVPTPATLEILRGVPVAASSAPFELTTPTGAAILKTITDDYSAMPAMTIESVGYGAGKKDFKGAANVLRLVTGFSALPPKDGDASGADSPKGSPKIENLWMLETNVDDMTAEVAGYLMERLFDAGALDAYYTPVQMKKSRPGLLISVLSTEELRAGLTEILFTESTTIGLRATPVERAALERKSIKVSSGYGRVSVKVSTLNGKMVSIEPEYEECRAIAKSKGVALKEVMAGASAAARRSLNKR